jgi:DnaJ homolog subfamily C member 17
VAQDQAAVTLSQGLISSLPTHGRAKATREQHNLQQSDKRRKLREDLEGREKRAATDRNEEETAKMRLRAELERLRRRAEEEERRGREQAAAAAVEARVAGDCTAWGAVPGCLSWLGPPCRLICAG